DWKLHEVQLYVGTTPAPKTSPGTFPYKAENLGGVNNYKFTIPLSWPSGTSLYMAAHAVVKTPTQSETAWGAGDCLAFPKSWGSYICYTTLEETANGAEGDLAYIPAEAAGSKVFVNKYEAGPVASITYHDNHGNSWNGTPAPNGGWRMDVLDIPPGYTGGTLGVELVGDPNEETLWEMYFEGVKDGSDSSVRLID
ncbi:MAG TPA: hypothetical protein VEI97_15400, partial [bacterium]|nr:hypothetical protein [bacterium]